MKELLGDEMSHFEYLNKNMDSVLKCLINSQPLCKLLYYDSFNPLSESDIPDTKKLLFHNIFPFPKVPETTDNAITYLNVTFDKFTLGDTKAVKGGLVIFTVITHSDLWQIKGGLRPFSILSEIDSLFNDKRVIGLKKNQFVDINLIWANDNFSGYEARYRIVNEN